MTHTRFLARPRLACLLALFAGSGALSLECLSRGAVSALYVNNPDPFYRSSVEQICALLADQVVDTMTGTPLFSSSNSTQAIADMTHNLMGLDSSRDTAAIGVLTSHYSAATSAGKTATVALKSTFTLACISPWVVSVGQ